MILQREPGGYWLILQLES